MDWLKIAEKLPQGQSVRWHHCGKDEAAAVFHNADSYSMYCHRCGHKEYQSFGYRNYKELLEVKRRNDEALRELQTSRLALPKNFTLDIPPEGMLWLLKASITPYMAREAGFGWDSYFQRVILPVYNDSALVYYQARAVLQGQKPKYLNPKVDRSKVLYWQRGEGTRLVIVTEDILSAHRVHHATGLTTCSLLGTKVTIDQANQLAQYDKVITWLDPDSAGINGALKVRKLVGLAADVQNITSQLDPKLLTNMQIKEILNV